MSRHEYWVSPVVKVVQSWWFETIQMTVTIGITVIGSVPWGKVLA